MGLDRAAFQEAIAAPLRTDRLVKAAREARIGETAAQSTLALAFAHAAFAAPQTTFAIYSAFSAGWLGSDAHLPDMPDDTSAPPPAVFWQVFWSILDDARAGMLDAGGITVRVSALGRCLDPSLRERAEIVARSWAKAAKPELQAMPRKLRLEDLEHQPAGSLGSDFYRLIAENMFDLEVLDRDAIGLAGLPPALRYLNTRILQMHDVWHLVGGYRTTALHEVAISAFQLAQFGHGYSAMFLATIVAATLGDAGGGATFTLLQTIAEGWQHGSSQPSFMAIAWEEEWHLPIDVIRSLHGIVPFVGSLPADLFEQARGAA